MQISKMLDFQLGAEEGRYFTQAYYNDEVDREFPTARLLFVGWEIAVCHCVLRMVLMLEGVEYQTK